MSVRVRIVVLLVAVLGLFALGATVTEQQVAAVPVIGDALAGKGGGIATENTCAAVIGVGDAGACGNQSYRWYYIDSAPPGGYWVGRFGSPCSYSEYGYITYSYDPAGYRYTAQCRQA